LTGEEQKANIKRMDDRDRLALYPFVVVRIACRVCSRSGSYRLTAGLLTLWLIKND